MTQTAPQEAEATSDHGDQCQLCGAEYGVLTDTDEGWRVCAYGCVQQSEREARQSYMPETEDQDDEVYDRPVHEMEGWE